MKQHLENRNSILYIGNCNTLELAKLYDTPLYVYDETRIRENIRNLARAFKKYYSNFQVYYSLKANNNLALLKIIKSENCFIDASSLGEIYLAKKSGFTHDQILYSGFYHRNEELQYAIKKNVLINLEDISQIDRLFKYGKPEFLSLRVNPGIGKGKFNGLIVAGPDGKFGILERDILKAYEKAKAYGVKRFGIHMMTGSCISEEAYFSQITGRLLDIAGMVAKKLNIVFDMIDIGGGFGIPYQPEEKEINIENLAKNVCNVFNKKIKENNLGEPSLFIEPGRYIIGDASVLLTKVHAIKKAHRTFIGVDAGMNTLIRPMLYGAYHEILLANNLNALPKERVSIVGPVCENTDQLAKDRIMPIIKEGDLLAILDTGAYGFNMSSQYHGKPRAAEVLVNQGNHSLIRERETYEDLIAKVKIPERLK